MRQLKSAKMRHFNRRRPSKPIVTRHQQVSAIKIEGQMSAAANCFLNDFVRDRT